MNKHVKIQMNEQGRCKVLKGEVSSAAALKMLDLWSFGGKLRVKDPYFDGTLEIHCNSIDVTHHRDGTSTISASKHYWQALQEAIEVKDGE